MFMVLCTRLTRSHNQHIYFWGLVSPQGGGGLETYILAIVVHYIAVFAALLVF